MTSTHKKYMLCLILLSAALIIAWASLGDAVFADARPRRLTNAAIAFFFLCETLMMWMTEKKGQSLTPRRFVQIFMGMKAGKIFLSLFFTAIYALAGGAGAKRFALVFAALYLIYLLEFM